MSEIIDQAAEEYVKSCNYSDVNEPYSPGEVELECTTAFKAGAEWYENQNLWHNFKDKRPKPNSHILRKMIHPNYQSYGKVIYYADFWSEDRLDKWEQENDRVVYEWQYINE